MNSASHSGVWQNIVVTMLLVSSLAMIALAVAGNPREQLVRLPQLVHEALKKSVADAI